MDSRSATSSASGRGCELSVSLSSTSTSPFSEIFAPRFSLLLMAAFCKPAFTFLDGLDKESGNSCYCWAGADSRWWRRVELGVVAQHVVLLHVFPPRMRAIESHPNHPRPHLRAGSFHKWPVHIIISMFTIVPVPHRFASYQYVLCYKSTPSTPPTRL